MENATHANDDDTWTSLGFQTLLVLNKLRLDSQISEMIYASGEVNGASLLGASITTEMDTASHNPYAGYETAGSFIDVVAAAINVTRIHGATDISEIFETVIISDAVDMIDFVQRPVPVNPHPSKPMGLVINSIDSDDDVSAPSFGAGDGAGFGAIIHRDQPGEQACFQVIGKQMPEAFDSQVRMEVVSHIDFPKTSMEIKEFPERDETKQEDRNENESKEDAHEHQRCKLANMR